MSIVSPGARIWLFVGFLISFASLIGAGWVLFGEYVVTREYHLRPMTSLCIQTPSSTQRAACSVTARASHCHNLWRRYREHACLSDFLYYRCILLYHRTLGVYNLKKCMYVCVQHLACDPTVLLRW